MPLVDAIGPLPFEVTSLSEQIEPRIGVMAAFILTF
jgi:hypothetical protein